MTERSARMNIGMSRRSLFRKGAVVAGASALAGALPDSLLTAATASAATAGPFDASKVKHLVFVMQENRSFDHYFGTFPGVAGFSDPAAVTLPDGQSVFQQPDPFNPDGYLEPYHIDTFTTGAAAIPSLDHDWQPQHAAWNNGLMDGWLRAHVAADGSNGSFTMGHYTQADIPFHWALAETFTLLDHYHCSVLGPTIPNRLMWMTGSIDPQGKAGGPILETAWNTSLFPNSNGEPVLGWKTAIEVLYEAGYTTKVYTTDDVGFNVFQWFGALQDQATVPADLWQSINSISTLWGDGTPGGLGDPANPTKATDPSLSFEEDCLNGTLPDVSWIMPTAAAQEHPPALPALGGQWLAQKLDALASNQDIWNSTVFVLSYDENDGYFDHVLPPTPDPAEYPEEFVTVTSPFGSPGNGLPVGAGWRVPCVIVSPWTVGGQVYTRLADHTSCLRLIEEVTAGGGLSNKGPVTFGEISTWRRKTFDDLTGALRPGVLQPAPYNPQFDSIRRAIDAARQTTTSSLPMPVPPGMAQAVPVQDRSYPRTGPVSGW